MSPFIIKVFVPTGIRLLNRFVLIPTLILTSAQVLAGPDWDEIGDAGPLPKFAQRLYGLGPVKSIAGALALSPLAGERNVDSQDAYLIRITAPTRVTFSASTSFRNGGFANFNTRLWLFDASGLGLLANDDDPIANDGSSTLLNASDDGTAVVIRQPGVYVVVITGSESTPLDFNGDPIFFLDQQTEISGPDGTGGRNPIFSWTEADDIGDYIIGFDSAAFVIPGDLNGDGLVNGADLGLLLGSWGECTGSGVCLADLDENGVVDGADVGLLLANWSQSR